MSKMIRAWKDEEYRLSLSETDRAGLAENPAGSLELADAELDAVNGGGCFITVNLSHVNVSCNRYSLVVVVVSF
jgi:mersacidin/lichenicidin family type 2 lantibiotic